MWCLHCVKIAFLFIPFEHLRLEHKQILLDLFWAHHKLSSDTIKFHRGKAAKQAEQAFKVTMQSSEQKNHNKSFCAIRQLLNKMKDLVKSVILLGICKQRNSVGGEFARKSCWIWVWQFCCPFKKKHMMFVCAHNHDSVSLVFILTFEA